MTENTLEAMRKREATRILKYMSGCSASELVILRGENDADLTKALDLVVSRTEGYERARSELQTVRTENTKLKAIIAKMTDAVACGHGPSNESMCPTCGWEYVQ